MTETTTLCGGGDSVAFEIGVINMFLLGAGNGAAVCHVGIKYRCNSVFVRNFLRLVVVLPNDSETYIVIRGS